MTLKQLLPLLVLIPFACFAREKPGATVPWITYEAEQMRHTGKILGPGYNPYQVETASSNQQCVQLGKGQYVEFTARAKANSLVIRYSLPDDESGKGLTATLGIYRNGQRIQNIPVSSALCRLYGKYPFTNDPAAGKPRNFYDDVRITNISLAKGDVTRIQLNAQPGESPTCIIDLADLENIPPALKAPANSLSITNPAFLQPGIKGDYTGAFRKCIDSAQQTGKSVWLPAGTFIITGDLLIPAGLTIQGAGIWYSTLTGNDSLYTDAAKRVRLKGNGSNIHLADFAITGKLNYRSDREPNDGIVGSFGTHSTIQRLWIEHTKVGMWIENSDSLQIDDCRLRNTIADGINFCVGMRHSVINNCTARNTGDDCFAIWPAVFAKQQYKPGYNLITHCTGQLPFLANGAAVYGGENNAVKNCSFTDITAGSAILISTTFPTATKNNSTNNNFSGTTIIENCSITNSGGFDHEWDWRAAVEICLDKRDIAGIQLRNLVIQNSLSNAVNIIAKNEVDKAGKLSNTLFNNVQINGYGIATKESHALYISPAAHGSLKMNDCNITYPGSTEQFSITSTHAPE
ncbi:glycosyl hydrolase family 28-related protein [Deminuibacter soli]|uniref:Uncharacterized protein n=1 Tax=Deminuibacter soli TaxID=2291815 RepID=A0A3E1NDJ8_9BACT|nr:glycosyl hydrolase family 28-related protein [Deminuibacter soli]RFM26010.1 hypothetical protein DXN05_22055 [Deminuibacter soli]